MHVRKAITLDPKRVESYISLDRLYITRENIPEAEAAIKRYRGHPLSVAGNVEIRPLPDMRQATLRRSAQFQRRSPSTPRASGTRGHRRVLRHQPPDGRGRGRSHRAGSNTRKQPREPACTRLFFMKRRTASMRLSQARSDPCRQPGIRPCTLPAWRDLSRTPRDGARVYATAPPRYSRSMTRTPTLCRCGPALVCRRDKPGGHPRSRGHPEKTTERP